MQLIRVRFPVATYGATDFQLGPGPCGKVVAKLDAALLDEGSLFRIVQSHTDGTAKRFTYRMADITGRIEEEFA